MGKLDKVEWALGLSASGFMLIMLIIAEMLSPRSGLTHVILACAGLVFPLTIYISRLFRRRGG
jgi:hypothetical protein